MRKKILFFIACAPLLYACGGETGECPSGQKDSQGNCYVSDNCSPECDAQTQRCYNGKCYSIDDCMPACKDDQTCVEGTCVPASTCFPECDEATEKCYRGTCVGKDECTPECKANDEKCVDGKCISIKSCSPECEDGLVCVDGECKPQSAAVCEGKLCMNNVTYCDETGHWKSCESGYGCHLGYCLKGLGEECQNGACSDDKDMVCQGGTWVKCGSMSSCVDGKCEVSKESCEAGSCSEDKRYRCTDEETYLACPHGTVCDDGKCTSASLEEDAMLWQLCKNNAGCAQGVCVFEVATSRTMTINSKGLENVDVIPVSALDSRIPVGMGICSQDCTRDTSICDDISTNARKFTCQVAFIGDSPYPPSDDTGIEKDLPFYKYLNMSDMEIAPYASLCRPNDVEEVLYSEKFCSECAKSSQCGERESCIMGMCLTPCSSSDLCPLGFSCAKVENMSDNFCVPNSGTCGKCLDFDNDGQGWGDCEKQGFDCDDKRSDVYYQMPLLASSCTTNYTDDNCNGIIDYTELIGSADNCDQCGSICKPDENATNITQKCVLNNGGLSLDDSSPELLASTYVYSCDAACDDGYADCDGNLSNGCETKLFDVADMVITPTEDAIVQSLDADQDGHGSMESDKVRFCCKEASNVCYALPNSFANPRTIWDKTEPKEVTWVSAIDDCDDSKNNRFPGNPDICDGIDNDCDDNTADGSAVKLALSNTTFDYSEDAEGTFKLGDTCSVYHASTHEVCNDKGKVVCDAANKKLICSATSGDTDATCDGIDDNCNGRIDEDYQVTACSLDQKKGICKVGIMTCKDGKPTCESLFTARAYDFYGDGVDSNCDGEDWDVNGAIYLENGGDSAGEGDATHTGEQDSPLESLNDAFDKAYNEDDGFYKDIIISDSMTTQKSNDYKWGKESIKIPTKDRSKLWNPGLKEAISLEEHIAAYQNAYKENQPYDANVYLAEGEIYPPKEVIRIYGGFKHQGNAWSASAEQTTYSFDPKYIANITNEQVFPRNYYTMIQPLDSYPMSLRLDNILFEMSTSNSAKQTGVTFIGLTCGKYGCSDLMLNHSNIQITAPNGVSNTAEQHSTNDIYDKYEGIKGGSVNLDDDGVGQADNYVSNFSKNVCMSSTFVDNKWFDYKKIESSNYDLQCPDRTTPRGGCGGHVCCKNDCSYDSHRGKAAMNEDNRPENVALSRGGCGSDSSVDSFAAKGIAGTPGAGGAGGDNSKLQIAFEVDDRANVYLETQTKITVIPIDPVTHKPLPSEERWIQTTDGADGKAGKSGGGGSGGNVYQCMDQKSYDDFWVFAGSGGAGGCGGHGGKAGGTGGSSIGMVLTPPSDGSVANISLNESKVTSTGGSGGAGQSGQMGHAGGQGGLFYGYAYHKTIDGHCHKATAGGAGAGGGGGGGGAGGRAGHAYGFVFMCNRKETAEHKPIAFDSLASMSECGFNFPGFVKNSKGFSTVTAQNDLKNGSAGSAGTITKAGVGLTGEATRTSTGGEQGTGGSEETQSDREVAKHFVLLKQDF